MAHGIGLADILRSCDQPTFELSVAQAKAWLAARRSELLPVPYFHLVFTLPHDLNGLAGCDPRTLYELLFGAVSDTLTAFSANPRWLGGTPGFTLVLHTWKQDLGRHIHVHALVAGGALTADKQWISPKRGFLFPVHALSRVFRGKFIDALESARTAGRLRHYMVKDSSAWRDLKTRLRRHDWVVYAKEPLGGPAQVLEYLGRYTHRVAISNERILGMEGDIVRFRMRDSAHGNRRKVVHMAASEFVRRFLLHVLPGGFKRIRHYGLLGPAHKTVNLAAAREALAAPVPDPVVVESVEAFMQRVAGIEWMDCPHCRTGHFHFMSVIIPAAAPRSHGPP